MPAKPKRKRRLLRWLAWSLAVTAVVGGVGWYVVYTYVLKAGFAEVVPGEIYRSSQPSEGDLRAYVERHGIRSVFCLRGTIYDEADEETRAARALGLRLYRFEFASNLLPEPEAMRAFVAALESAPRPILLHCGSGINRAGTASAVAALVVGQQGYEQARRQLPLYERRRTPQNISDVLDRYDAYCRRTKQDRDSADVFKTWVAQTYPNP